MYEEDIYPYLQSTAGAYPPVAPAVEAHQTRWDASPAAQLQVPRSASSEPSHQTLLQQHLQHQQQQQQHKHVVIPQQSCYNFCPTLPPKCPTLANRCCASSALPRRPLPISIQSHHQQQQQHQQHQQQPHHSTQPSRQSQSYPQYTPPFPPHMHGKIDIQSLIDGKNAASQSPRVALRKMASTPDLGVCPTAAPKVVGAHGGHTMSSRSSYSYPPSVQGSQAFHEVSNNTSTTEDRPTTSNVHMTPAPMAINPKYDFFRRANCLNGADYRHYCAHLQRKQAHAREGAPSPEPTDDGPPDPLANVAYPHRKWLNASFYMRYELGQPLGSGGYGYVFSGVRYRGDLDVAVKFIDKSKVPAENWACDTDLGIVPVEVFMLKHVDHENIIKFIDYYDDDRFCYLVTELHGAPWKSSRSEPCSVSSSASSASGSPPPPPAPKTTCRNSNNGMPPKLPPIKTCRPSASFGTQKLSTSPTSATSNSSFCSSASQFSSGCSALHSSSGSTCSEASSGFAPSDMSSGSTAASASSSSFVSPTACHFPPPTQPLPQLPPAPKLQRRQSMDLFECIEQFNHLTESQAHHIFRQVMSAIQYLHSIGIVHRDIKDENILVDEGFSVKLIDFGSAAFMPNASGKLFDRFLGTVQFAAPEILRGEKYRGPEAEIWALGCCLYIMLNGQIPFSSAEQAKTQRYFLPKRGLSRSCLDLLDRMLSKCPSQRLTVGEVLEHEWMRHGC